MPTLPAGKSFLHTQVGDVSRLDAAQGSTQDTEDRGGNPPDPFPRRLGNTPSQWAAHSSSDTLTLAIYTERSTVELIQLKATVIRRTPLQQVPTSDGMFNQTMFGYADGVPFSPSMMPFANAGQMSAPPMPQQRLFWDGADTAPMDVDTSGALDPFGPTPNKLQGNLGWQTFHTPVVEQMQAQFQPQQSMSSAGPMASFDTHTAGEGHSSQTGSFASTAGVDPSMLFSFTSPDDIAASFGSIPQQATFKPNRQPYETQMLDSRWEKEKAKKSKSLHSRSNTNSSSGSVEETWPGLQRSNTDSGFRRARPVISERRSSADTSAAHHIPRRSSPLKRANSGALKAIPEVIRRPRTRLIIDADGRARTETVPAEEEEVTPRDMRKNSQTSMRHQYPALWEEGDTESDSDDAQPTLSRNTSFSMPQSRRHGQAYFKDHLKDIFECIRYCILRIREDCQAT
ncbi:hypothetical protein E8E12_009106 [Didymella heteroderae]|uniref:Uncharacterized protein n=1 Tax=Didymella heteroderae TaxID=1769908 RepID=A0A9P4WTA5_9PLEO|nr:hypothetical protein E8E12_009106 [Didymella heteroderae]